MFSPWRSTVMTQRSVPYDEVAKPSVSTPSPARLDRMRSPCASAPIAATRRTSAAAARRRDRLIGALAAKILGGAASHDRFTGPRKPVHSNHAVDRGVADHMDHSARVIPRADQPLQRLAPEPGVSRPRRELGRQPVRADVRRPRKRAAPAEGPGDEQRLAAVVGRNGREHLAPDFALTSLKPSSGGQSPAKPARIGCAFCLMTGVNPSGTSTRSS